MKKTIFFSLLLGIIFSLNSCKKESSNPDSGFYIQAKVDGIQKNYTANGAAVVINVDGNHSIGMAAYASASSIEGFSLAVARETGTVTTGTYIDGASDDVLVLGGFNSTGTTTDESQQYSSGLATGSDPKLQIVITELTASKVSGTFSGTFFSNMGDNKISVTEGKFNLPIY
ncbi:MAG: hypothetical protein ACTHJ5_10145 [Ilyomonas sp.]